MSKPSCKSWFVEIRSLCLQYGLPHPLVLLQAPPTKDNYRKLIKKHLINFWEIKLREEAAPLTSLKYFDPNFMSLTTPHPIWTTAGSSPYHVTMSTIQAVMLSGRYRTEQLCSNWSSNRSGFCQAPSCIDQEIPEDIDHILLKCGSLQNTRSALLQFTAKYCQSIPELEHITDILRFPDHPSFCQLLLDCSVLPEVISASQQLGPTVLHHLYRITRTWCYCLHRARMKLLGRWQRF